MLYPEFLQVYQKLVTQKKREEEEIKKQEKSQSQKGQYFENEPLIRGIDDMKEFMSKPKDFLNKKGFNIPDQF